MSVWRFHYHNISFFFFNSTKLHTCFIATLVLFYITGNTEDGLLYPFSFHYELWINILGKLFT